MPYAHVREVTVEQDGQIRLEGLPFRAGDRVRLFVMRRRDPSGRPERYPLRGKPLRYDDPFGPAADPDEWEANG